MISFWILWVFNALMALVPVYLFFAGLTDGSITSTNFGLWILILVLVAGLLGGTYWLKTKNQLVAARILLILAAIPSLLAILFLVIATTGNVRWN